MNFRKLLDTYKIRQEKYNMTSSFMDLKRQTVIFMNVRSKLYTEPSCTWMNVHTICT